MESGRLKKNKGKTKKFFAHHIKKQSFKDAWFVKDFVQC